jgi:hypothetical protein
MDMATKKRLLLRVHLSFPLYGLLQFVTHSQLFLLNGCGHLRVIFLRNRPQTDIKFLEDSRQLAMIFFWN